MKTHSSNSRSSYLGRVPEFVLRMLRKHFFAVAPTLSLVCSMCCCIAAYGNEHQIYLDLSLHHVSQTSVQYTGGIGLQWMTSSHRYRAVGVQGLCIALTENRSRTLLQTTPVILSESVRHCGVGGSLLFRTRGSVFVEGGSSLGLAIQHRYNRNLLSDDATSVVQNLSMNSHLGLFGNAFIRAGVRLFSGLGIHTTLQGGIIGRQTQLGIGGGIHGVFFH